MRFTLLLFLLTTLPAAGAEYPEFAGGMKSAGKAMELLSKSEKKTGAQITGAAEHMASIYEEMIPFFRLRNDNEAVKWSQEGKAAATRLASASFAGDEAKAGAALQALGATCKSCHGARRERTPEGKYVFKKRAE